MDNEVLNATSLESELVGLMAADADLNGLSAPQRKRVAKYVVGQTKKLGFNATNTRSMKFLVQMINELPEQDRKMLIDGQLKFRDFDFYVRVPVTGQGGMIVLLQPSNVYNRGVSNIDKNRLPIGTNLILSRMRIGWGTSVAGAILDPASVSYVSENVVAATGIGSCPTPLANGDIKVMVEDKPIVELPVARFLNQSRTPTGMNVGDSADFLLMEALKLVKADRAIRIELYCPTGTLTGAVTSFPAVGVSATFVEVRLAGVGTVAN